MRVFAYPFDGYWVDVGTIDSYWNAHMDLLSFPPVFNLYDRGWIMHTRSEERPPVKIKEGAVVKDSMLSDGTLVAADAIVERSVLSPGVYVGPGAVVRERSILTDASIEAGARVERAIIDKLVTVGHNAQVGRIVEGATDLGITTIGKNVKVPNGLKARPECHRRAGCRAGPVLAAWPERRPNSTRPQAGAGRTMRPSNAWP